MADFKTIASYEVLAQPIAPVMNVPFVQQGAFLQVTNLLSKDTTVDIEYKGTPIFVKTSGPILLETNIIKEDGLASLTSYDQDVFLNGAFVGFKSQIIPGNTTWLFGVQYIIPPGTMLPTNGIDARGYLNLRASDASKLLVLATIRQVFTNFNGSALLDITESAYVVPLATGPVVTF